MKINGNIPAVPDGYVKAMEQKKEKLGDNENAMKNWGKKFEYLPPEDQLSISFLQDETEKNYDRLKEIVKDMLRRQGVEVDKIEYLKDEDVEGVVIDEEAQAEAAYMIGPDGPLNAENTADRIFSFAKAISGGDTSKYQTLKDAIDEGFNAVKDLLGGELPEISENTYDLVMEKLDEWAGIEGEDAEETVAVETPSEETTPVQVPVEEESIVDIMLNDDEEEEESLIEQMMPDVTEEVEEK